MPGGHRAPSGARRVGLDAVRVVDDRGRQPQDPVLDRLQRGLRGLRRLHGGGDPMPGRTVPSRDRVTFAAGGTNGIESRRRIGVTAQCVQRQLAVQQHTVRQD